jgi:hypothetical protein
LRTTTKYALYLVALLASALLAVFEWRAHLFDKDPQEDIPRYSQCEKVYVGKRPWACQPGDLIFVDADVADKYCTDEVFSRSDDSVYCVYNGHRDDRERHNPPFKTRTFKDIKKGN